MENLCRACDLPREPLLAFEESDDSRIDREYCRACWNEVNAPLEEVVA